MQRVFLTRNECPRFKDPTEVVEDLRTAADSVRGQAIQDGVDALGDQTRTGIAELQFELADGIEGVATRLGEFCSGPRQFRLGGCVIKSVCCNSIPGQLLNIRGK